MQSLGKRPQSGKSNNLIQSESPFQAEKTNTKPEEAPKPITDQWSTNRLQQTFKNQQQQSNQRYEQTQQQRKENHISDTNSNASSMSGSSKQQQQQHHTKGVNSNKQQPTARPAAVGAKNGKGFDHEQKDKRERSGNSETSSSRSFAHKASVKNASKEGSTEPFYQNGNCHF